jgi:hypothetical protein
MLTDAPLSLSCSRNLHCLCVEQFFLRMLLYNMLLLKCVRNDDYGDNDNVVKYGKFEQNRVG